MRGGGRLRSSLLLKVLASLFVALLTATGLTTFLDVRLTADALSAQAVRITNGNLRVLQQAYGERERTLVANLRNLAQVLNAEGLTHPSRRNDLVGELGRAYRNLEFDVLQVVDTRAVPTEQPAGVGEALAGPVALSPADGVSPASRLLRTAQGEFVQAVVVPIGYGSDAHVLVGGYHFADAFAYRLRRQVAGLAHVVLVADGQVVGTTLVDAPQVPPAVTARGERLPRDPVVVRLAGVDTLVAYRPASASPGAVAGALGVAVPDPEAPVDRLLARNRLVAVGLLIAVALLLGWLLFRALMRPLVDLQRTAARISEGDLDASFVPRGTDEIAELARSLEGMRRELRQHLDVIAEQAARLRESSSRIAAAQDEERHRLARDLHDGIQQHLVVLRMGFGLAREAAERDPGSLGGSLGGSLEELSRELDGVIERLREVTHDLYPSILVDRGLVAALRSCAGRLPVPVRLVCAPDPFPRLAPEIESAAYFLTGEALVNALKHAEASEITICLDADDEWLTITVEDDGRGFVPAGHSRGGGLLHMEDRARSFGGDLEVTSAPDEGTRVRARFPVRVAAGVSGV